MSLDLLKLIRGFIFYVIMYMLLGLFNILLTPTDAISVVFGLWFFYMLLGTHKVVEAKINER